MATPYEKEKEMLGRSYSEPCSLNLDNHTYNYNMRYDDTLYSKCYSFLINISFNFGDPGSRGQRKLTIS